MKAKPAKRPTTTKVQAKPAGAAKARAPADAIPAASDAAAPHAEADRPPPSGAAGRIIECGGAPLVPETSWRYATKDQLSGRVQGDVVWDKTKQGRALYVSPKQKDGYVDGAVMRKELAKRPVLPAQVLDWLLAHPTDIPTEWRRTEEIAFWGSIFHAATDPTRFVRCLTWTGTKWIPSIKELIEENFGDECAAALGEAKAG